MLLVDKFFGFVIIAEVVLRSSLGEEDRDENVVVVSVEGASHDWIRKASDRLGAIIDSTRLIEILDEV